MKRIVVLSGAGISAESGIQTFRDHNGLWRNYRFEEVASPEAWNRNPLLVLEFYNIRRKQLYESQPNAAHKALVRLDEKFDVHVVTQNVDDLHERAGSRSVLHLHGELKKARSTGDPDLVYDLKHWELKWGDKCEKGYQLRPHVVWFGEAVPMFEPACRTVAAADVLIIVGTSLAVYPAAGLVGYVPDRAMKYFVDTQAFDVEGIRNLTVIRKKAGEGIP
ncbi:MAG: NAD-dependent deacylase, partial [Bacteroidales bacterium]|nr:NAD-dependent deacylase [Bacteroidales bacterium]